MLDKKLFFSREGRLGRQKYLIANGLILGVPLAIGLVLYLLSSLFSQYEQVLSGVYGVLGIILFLVSSFAFYFHINFVTKRFHDLNLSGWVVFITILIGAFGVVGIVLIILVELWLMFRKGTNGTNKFGDDPLLAEGITSVELTLKETNKIKPNTPAPIKSVSSFATSDEHTKMLEKLKEMLDKGLISEQDYETKKAEVLSKM